MRVRFADTTLQISHHPDTQIGAEQLVCIRPHALRLSNEDQGGNRIRATVTDVQWQGDHHAITLDCAGTSLRLVTKPLRDRLDPGTDVALTFDPDDATLIVDGG
jgi:ABC-type Fe3+/spermidine/putrescine transport system ATPase subunit